MSSGGTEVHLAIYDLSQGMARSLSAQFLGNDHAIDIIPHTGIVVFGKEYYFGSMGIESSDPSFFRQSRGLYPVECQFLGRTNVTQERFEAWCHQLMLNGSYAGSSYDLLHRNCNNFSHHAATEGLGLSKGAPDWVLSVPQRFLSSPMGQMMRPMLEQMQLSGPTGGGSSVMPSSTPQFATNNIQPAAATLPQDNPWAHYPSSETSNSIKEDSPAPKKLKTEPLETPVLSSHNRPLLSNDTKMVPLCIKKIKGGMGIMSMDEKRRETLLATLEHLPLIFDVDQNDDEKKDKVSTTMEQLLELVLFDKATASEKTFSLMIIRLLVLQKEIDSKVRMETMQSVKKHCISDGDNVQRTPTALRSMAWCVLSNAIGCSNNDIESENQANSMETFVDAAISGLSFENANEVRQSASAFLHNLILFLNSRKKELSDDHMSDLHVMILCGVAEGMADETDEVVLTRRLLTIGKIVRDETKTDDKKEQIGVNDAAMFLFADLGYIEPLTSVSKSKCGSGQVTSQLAAEIVKIVTRVSS